MPACASSSGAFNRGAAPFHLGRRRRTRAYSPSENEIHRAVVEHLRRRATKGVIFWHTPNGMKAGGKRSKKGVPIQASIMAGLGVRAGVADLILVHRGSVYALELKSSTGRPTVAQMEFMSEFRAAGGQGVICHDIDKALRCLEIWGLIK